MENTWGTTRTGMVFHSFKENGAAICRSNITRPEGVDALTETQVDARLAEAWGARVRGFRKCESCTQLEAASRDRAEASMEPSTGEGDYLPPAQDATAPEEEKEDDMSSPRSRPVTGPLTPRQRDILDHVSRGMTHEATAQELGVSRVWVSENMRMAVAKMGVSNSWEAVARWMRRQALLDAADMIQKVQVTYPADSSDRHVNHVLDSLAQILRDRAARLIPS